MAGLTASPRLARENPSFLRAVARVPIVDVARRRGFGYTQRNEMSVYLTRSNAALLSPQLGDTRDTAFINQRFDGQALAGVRFEHCTFANVSFLNARLSDCHFSNCVFERCYFRKTKLTECHFPASRFVACEFAKPTIFACGFQHTRFERSVPSFNTMESNLPGEPNLCRDLCANLASEAAVLGKEREARSYRLEAIRMHEEALRRGYRWSDAYSRDHFPELQRVTAFVRLSGSKVNGWIWGHGEYLRRLLASLFVLAVVIGPALLYSARGHLHSDDPISLGDCFALSIGSVLGNSSAAGVTATGVGLAVVLALTAMGLLFLGLFVTYVFRAVTRR